MGKCKHERIEDRIWTRNGFLEHMCILSDPDARICQDCGFWLPLGHSDETDARVALEIDAAGVVASGIVDFVNVDGILNSGEMCGPDCSYCLIAFLAAVIASHDPEAV